MVKMSGERENVLGRGTVCMRVWRKVFLRVKYLWSKRSLVGWSFKCERRGGDGWR